MLKDSAPMIPAQAQYPARLGKTRRTKQKAPETGIQTQFLTILPICARCAFPCKLYEWPELLAVLCRKFQAAKKVTAAVCTRPSSKRDIS